MSESSSKGKSSFVTGAAVLALAGLIGKVIGMFYKIWLIGLISAEGFSFYQAPYSLYQFLLVLSSAGLPTAISKMVSEQIALGKPQGAKLILRKTRMILFCTGLAATAIMAALSNVVAAAIGDPASAPGFVALAPAIFFVCVMSAYRGYFQGQQNMTPTAVSQIVEQVGKVALGFVFAIALREKGLVWGAVGAIVGVSLSELIAMGYMLIRYKLMDRRLPRQGSAPAVVDKLYRRLFAIAIPVTIGASMMPIVSMVDTALVLNLLTGIGYAIEEARSMYGVLTGSVISIVNMPAVITLSISMALVPAISACKTKGDNAGLRATVSTGLKIAFLLGSAAAVGMGLLSKEIISLLFSSTLTAQEVEIGGRLLSYMAIAVFFLSIVQSTTGMLQGIGKPIYPVYTLLTGIIVKIVLNMVLISQPSINVAGAAIATVCCYAVAGIANVSLVLILSDMKLAVGEFLIRPAIAAGGMALSVWAVKLLKPMLGQTVTTLAAVAVGVVVYLALMLLCGCLSKSDLSFLPGGNKIGRLLAKMHIRLPGQGKGERA